MSYELSRRDFLRMAAGATTTPVAIGLGALANEASAQTKKVQANASRRFLDVLVKNLHTGKVHVNQDGSYSVVYPEGEGSNERFEAIYKPISPQQQELLVVEISDAKSEDQTRRYKFENPGVRDLPSRVIEYTMEQKEVPFEFKTLPKPLQQAHRRVYERALNELSKYLTYKPVQKAR